MTITYLFKKDDFSRSTIMEIQTQRDDLSDSNNLWPGDIKLILLITTLGVVQNVKISKYLKNQR